MFLPVFDRGQVIQRTMRTDMIVVLPPRFNRLSCILQIVEDGLVQTFLSETPVEALVECILKRLAWPDELQRDTVAIRPCIQYPAVNSGPLST